MQKKNNIVIQTFLIKFSNKPLQILSYKTSYIQKIPTTENYTSPRRTHFDFHPLFLNILLFLSAKRDPEEQAVYTSTSTAWKKLAAEAVTSRRRTLMKFHAALSRRKSRDKSSPISSRRHRQVKRAGKFSHLSRFERDVLKFHDAF